jgi:hypothetical protein
VVDCKHSGYLLSIDTLHLSAASFAILGLFLVAPAAAIGADLASTADLHHAGVVERSNASQRASPSKYHSVSRQYHEITPAILPSFRRPIAHWKCCYISARISKDDRGETTSGGSGGGSKEQYQPAPSQYQDDDRMLEIGAVLGMAYLAFLAIWIWATRFRPH